jgi:hypothetical protein
MSSPRNGCKYLFGSGRVGVPGTPTGTPAGVPVGVPLGQDPPETLRRTACREVAP